MGLQRLTIEGYGQLELNQVTFPRDGRIEAQCALSTADFSTSTVCENGMLLGIDAVNRLVKKPTAGAVVGLVYSTEHMYDQRANALKDFFMVPGEFYPRLGYITLGDKFTTNCIAYDTADFANDSALLSGLAGVASTALYGQYCANGAIQVVATAPTVGPKLVVVKKTTMPDGQVAAQFKVIG